MGKKISTYLVKYKEKGKEDTQILNIYEPISIKDEEYKVKNKLHLFKPNATMVDFEEVSSKEYN